LALRALEWATIILAASCLSLAFLFRDTWRGVPFSEALLWVLAVGVCDLLPVRLWQGLTLALSFPILLAAAFLYPPEVVAAIALLGSTDLRELRREVTVSHSLFNRSQVAVSAAAASVMFHAFDIGVTQWPRVLVVAFLALSADMLVNWSLVYLALRAMRQDRIRTIVANASGNSPGTFLSTYFAFGLVAILLALAVDIGGPWGLIAVAIPILLAREVFVRSVELRDTALLLAEKSRMLLTITEKIADERRDERLALAAGLHDDLLPPLFKVHLLGQVIRQDLATGQLLALDEDVPDLVSATELANSTASSLIRRLRASPVGPDGLASTLQLLVRSLSTETSARIDAQLDDAGGAPVVQLLAYQVAREALRNAIRHACARNIWLRLEREEAELRLTIKDDGVGFTPGTVDESAHFGLQLMRERVELAGGIFRLDASVGAGTRIVVRLPGKIER